MGPRLRGDDGQNIKTRCGRSDETPKRKTPPVRAGFFVLDGGAPGTIRTSDPQIRSLMLYPAELRAPTIFNPNKDHITPGRKSGAPGTIRTSDPQIRSLMLYPAELRAPWRAASRGGIGIGQRLCSAFLQIVFHSPQMPLESLGQRVIERRHPQSRDRAGRDPCHVGGLDGARLALPAGANIE